MRAIAENPQESRKEWMLKLFKYFGSKTSQKQNMQFWKHDNHPSLAEALAKANSFFTHLK